VYIFSSIFNVSVRNSFRLNADAYAAIIIKFVYVCFCFVLFYY
jgi:hypothetical protein